jgi:hypothetical protein
MKISELKSRLNEADTLVFELPNGTTVPAHFHVTEVGLVTKHFIDCGGTVRNEKVANFQLWEANDFDHRLAPSKFLGIILQSENLFDINDLDVEVEYQSETIGKYHLEFNDGKFKLDATQTNCLAQDKCGIPPSKLKVELKTIGTNTAGTCTPGGGCC